MEQYTVTGMSCAACQARVEKAVTGVDGVTSCTVSLLTNSMGVEGNASEEAIIKAVREAGYGASRKTNTSLSAEEALKDHETPKLKKRLILSVGFLLVLMYLTMGHHMLGLPIPAVLEHNVIALTVIQMVLALIVMGINRKFFTSGFSSLFHGSPNMDTLVALGSSVSFGWSLYVLYELISLQRQGASMETLMNLYHNELYFESAAMIPALITVGKMLEAMSKGRTTDALKGLMKLAPKTAVVLRNNQEVTVPIEEVKKGDLFVVRPGESIPADGVIREGTTSVNESALTGESIPVDKTAGDPVSAATINESGFIRCEATRVGEDTTLSQIIRMVSDAAATKAPIARIADKVSGVFVPFVILTAILTTAGWIVYGQTMSFALARGISVLVISCPCALGLATPVAIMVGNGLGARNGILFKTSESLETAGKAQIVALDKTGTITEGTPQVTDIFPNQIIEEELIGKAYALECSSEHPLARAIVAKATAGGLDGWEAKDVTALPGNGLTGILNGLHLHGGKGSYIETLCPIPDKMKKIAEQLADEGKTPLFLEEEGVLLGIIAAADVIRDDSSEAISELKRMGIRTVMLTGDNERTAKAIGKAADVDAVIAGVLPDEKESVIRRLKERGTTLMTGDGINDAPALTRADIGLAIGAGTDIAIDSADIVLMNSRLKDVGAAVRLSRATLRNIYENLFWAFFYNIICIPLAMGLYPWKMNPMVGAAAMSLSSFTVCMNALRLNLFDVHDASGDKPLRKKVKLSEEDIVIERPERRPELNETPSAGVKVQKQIREILRIDGMMCTHCEAAVRNALLAIEGVEEVKADHTAGQAEVTLSHMVQPEVMKQAVEDAGYIWKGVQKKEEETGMKKIMHVEGMMCPHCEANVKKALEAIEGVTSAEADHEKGIAEVVMDKEISDEVLKGAVEARDYKVTGIEKA